jgi:hypothetical protein
MRKKQPDLFALAADFWGASLEAQQVMALRGARILMQGSNAAPEITRMILEKSETAFKAQAAGIELLLTGKSHLIPQKTVARYRRKVRANRRRLIKTA